MLSIVTSQLSKKYQHVTNNSNVLLKKELVTQNVVLKTKNNGNITLFLILKQIQLNTKQLKL